MRTQGRVVDGPERVCCESLSSCRSLSELRSGVFSRPPFRPCAAHEGVTRDRLSSNVCHRGNRDTKPHRIRTGGITSLGRFGRAEMEMSVRRRGGEGGGGGSMLGE